MAVFDLEEQEKIDTLKAWWEKWGNWVTGVVVVIALVSAGRFGWAWWQKHQAEQALPYYETILTVNPTQVGALDRIHAAAVALEDSYSSTSYAPRGVLLASHTLLEQGHVDQAVEHLNWLVKNQYPSISPVARMNLASVFADQGRFEDALALLNSADPEFASSFKDRRADVLYLKGDRQEARSIWSELMAQEDLSASLRPLIEMKLNTLGE